MDRYDHFVRVNRLVPRVVTGISTVMMLALAVSLVISG